MKIGYLASGNLGLSTIIACKEFLQPLFIATDTKSVNIINYALENKIPLFNGNPRNGRLFEFVKGTYLDLLLSVNYVFIIENDLIEIAKYAINIHGSLLPKYRGRTPHVWAIINNESLTGISAHIIDSECDAGDIILQKEVKIDINDTGASLLTKFESIYPSIVKEIIISIKSNNISRKKQDKTKSTYFGKRIPDDGEINWNWQKERIRNWVRAQAYPYPGAFTFIDGKKIIIDEVSYSDLGFDYNNPNGMIIQIKPKILVKTQDGVICLESIRKNDCVFKIGKIFKNENKRI